MYICLSSLGLMVMVIPGGVIAVLTGLTSERNLAGVTALSCYLAMPNKIASVCIPNIFHHFRLLSNSKAKRR